MRLAVGRGRLHRLHAEAALRAGAVLDDDGLVERGAHVLGEQPRQRVARAAGGEREDDADRLLAELRVRRTGRRKACRAQQSQRPALQYVASHHGFPSPDFVGAYG